MVSKRPALPSSVKVGREPSAIPRAKRIASTCLALHGSLPGAWGQPNSFGGQGQGEYEKLTLQSGCEHPPRRHSRGPLATRSDPQPSALVHHPHRARWLASKGLTPESLALTYIIGKDNFREEDPKQMRAATRLHNDQALAKLCMDDPFDSDLIYKLARATPPRLGEYLEKLGFVEKELASAVQRGNNLRRDIVQKILETTGDMAEYLLPDAGEDDHPKGFPTDDPEEISFQLRVGAILLDFRTGRLDAQPKLDPRGTYSDAAMKLLDRHAKCVWIFKLFHQLKPKHQWTHTAIRSFVGRLWRRPAEQMASRFTNLVAIYDLALVLARFPEDNSTGFVTSVPEDVRALANLFRRSASWNDGRCRQQTLS
ncbi:hypothetical protein ACSSS7_005768 [Eimeria intestinalis]